MIPRTVGPIWLQSTDITQGGYYFMSLSTVTTKRRYKWTELPMPQDVVAMVQQIAIQQHRNPGFIFYDKDGALLQDTDNNIDENIPQQELVQVPATNENLDIPENIQENIQENHVPNNDIIDIVKGNNNIQEIIEINDDPFEDYMKMMLKRILIQSS